MIDIHCHILPGIDDGPQTMQESVLMAKMAYDDGITHIVATPHVKYELTEPSRILGLLAELNGILREDGIPLNVLRGADVNAVIDPGLLDPYTINGTRYILLEFPYARIPVDVRGTLFRFARAGLRPIITHPERNRSVISNLSLAAEIIKSGALIQITAGSITGEFGPEIAGCAEKLLIEGYVHFIASDAHSLRHRPPMLSEAVKRAAELVGKDSARALALDNPHSVISGCALSPKA